MQERKHRGALVQIQPHIAVRLWRLDNALAQCGERFWEVAAGMVGQGLQHPNLSRAPIPPSGGRCCMQPVEKIEHPVVALRTGPMLGAQQPGQSQVLVSRR